MTTQQTATYYTTVSAGFHVAGRRIPSERIDGVERPLVGHPLDLTPAEAAYELGAGTITREPPPRNAGPASPAAKLDGSE